ncbi:MAG: hypothetical protein LBK99_14830 [Opitutaceae bacterium]|jgi:hypothetical protein|nr:hypothetical protein [Opitutaceae bacterium]
MAKPEATGGGEGGRDPDLFARPEGVGTEQIQICDTHGLAGRGEGKYAAGRRIQLIMTENPDEKHLW